MALPSNWTRVTVQGQFLNLDGTPMTGQVTFTPTARVLLDATAGTVIAGTTWSVTLDGTGFFTVQLPATDDPDINPTGLTDVDDVASFSYTVSEPTGRRYNLAVPSAAGTIDLVAVGTAGTVTPPGAPTIGTATAGNGQATIAFTAPSNTGGATITGYTVTSSPGGITATGASSPIIVTGLLNGTTYTFTVRATNSAGSGAASAASNSVAPAGSSATVPGAPTIGTATAGAAGSGQVSVAFTPPVSDGGATITGYTVTSSPGGITGTGSSSPITVFGLIPGTAYTFTVKATNSVGTGADSAASNSVTPPVGSGPTNAPVLIEELHISAIDAAPLTTDTFTPSSGDVLIVKCGTYNSTLAPGAPSGGGLTWTQQIVENRGSFNGRVEIWTATVGTSPGPMTVTLSAPSASCNHGLFLERWSGGHLDVTPVTAAGFTNDNTAPSVDIATSGPNSAVSFVVYDGLNPYETERTWISPGVEVAALISTGGNGHFYSGQMAVDSAGTVSFGLTAPIMRWNMAGIEILGVATGGGGSFSTRRTAPVVVQPRGLHPARRTTPSTQIASAAVIA